MDIQSFAQIKVANPVDWGIHSSRIIAGRNYYSGLDEGLFVEFCCNRCHTYGHKAVIRIYFHGKYYLRINCKVSITFLIFKKFFFLGLVFVSERCSRQM